MCAFYVLNGMNTLLLSILSLVMTWTVETKSTVSFSGDAPAATDVEYVCSYQKGTVRSGDDATLTLTGMNGIVVERIEMYMRSNKSAGAGIVTIYADGAAIAQKEGSLRDWVGKYDNSTFYPIEVFAGQQRVQDALIINLHGTTNSLYVEKYVITYQQAPAYTATLMEGDEVYTTLTEPIGGAGVFLPSLPNKSGWQFVGWTDVPFWNISSLPENVYLPQTTIALTENRTLWAVWSQILNSQDVYMTNLQSGDYLYVNTANQLAIAGVVSNGVMPHAIVNPLDSNQIYHVEFDESAQKATIQHVLTGQYVGYEDAALIAEPTAWNVWHDGIYTVFYAVCNGKKYVLWQNIIVVTETDAERYAGLLVTNDVTQAPTALMCPQVPEEQKYTCYPKHDMSIDQTITNMDEIIVPFGIYEIHIRHGEKFVRLRQ